jgi:NAD+ kinase
MTSHETAGRLREHRFEKVAFIASTAPEAEAALGRLVARYANEPLETADVVVALGGDGLMLQTLHRLMGTRKPIYGMNRGSVGFLMNDFRENGLRQRLDQAKPTTVYPLLMCAISQDGRRHEARAINEVHLFRQTFQTAKLAIAIDGKERLGELIADGILVSTPAGSTAYNLSVNGPILPIDAPLLALTPISAFRPRRWRGALVPDKSKIVLDVREADKRPVSAVADHFEVRDVCRVEVAMDHGTELVLLHDPGHSLDERILREQFGS